MLKYKILLLIILTSPIFCSAQTDKIAWAEFHAPFQNSGNEVLGQKNNYPYVRFVTNAGNVVIRLTYQSIPNIDIKGEESKCMLYGLNDDGKWIEFEGIQSSGDTVITQSFQGISLDSHIPVRNFEYRLFLPEGKMPSLIAMGISAQSHIELMPPQPEKQIVIYKQVSKDKQSIPGTDWSARLERALDRPAMVLDRSSDWERFLRNGLKSETKAVFWELYVHGNATDEANKIIKETRQIQRAGIPVFIFPSGDTPVGSQDILKVVARRIANIKGIYLLASPTTDNWIAFNTNVRSILQEPDGEISTTKAVIQSRDRNYNWRQRHADELALIKEKAPQNIIFANSIIHYWGGLPKSTIARGQDSWNAYLQPLGVQNMGFGWDRIENVLWRIYHDELDGFKADHILLMIGTNNLQVNINDEIIQGLRQLIVAVGIRQPNSKVLISGILPRRNMEDRIALLNQSIEKLAEEKKVTFINPGTALLNNSGKIREELFGDGLHPNAVGYGMLAPAIAKAFSEH